MIELVIPNHKEELARLAEIGTSGFVVGFGLRFGQPDFFYNGYPKDWTAHYEEENYFFGDPVAAWTITRTGVIRWSDNGYPDVRNIMPEAAKFGLVYGATAVTKLERKRSFLSLSRSDRELTNAELDYVHGRIQLWAKSFERAQVSLSEGELQVLRMLRDGHTQAEAAAALDIPVSILKYRLQGAQKKLRASGTKNTIAIAVRQHLI